MENIFTNAHILPPLRTVAAFDWLLLPAKKMRSLSGLFRRRISDKTASPAWNDYRASALLASRKLSRHLGRLPLHLSLLYHIGLALALGWVFSHRHWIGPG